MVEILTCLCSGKAGTTRVGRTTGGAFFSFEKSWQAGRSSTAIASQAESPSSAAINAESVFFTLYYF